MERIQTYEIDDASTAERVMLNFNPQRRVADRRSFRADPTWHDGLQLTVRFTGAETGDPPEPVEVTLRSPAGLSASELSRFPWTRWLRVAEAASRLRNQYTVAGLDDARRSGADALRASRPGRKGHDESHYRQIARRYLDLTSEGHTNPVQEIADDEHVSRHTAAGWVRGARKRGLLPPARQGRAG